MRITRVLAAGAVLAASLTVAAIAPTQVRAQVKCVEQVGSSLVWLDACVELAVSADADYGAHLIGPNPLGLRVGCLLAHSAAL